jgi:hypothetical protein
MNSPISQKGKTWFLRVSHLNLTALYELNMGQDGLQTHSERLEE